MVDSKKPTILLFKYAVMLGIVVFSYLITLYSCIITDTGAYMAASIDKMGLLKESQSPKIIFVGGSNLAFGLDSNKVRQAFNMPVVNMGIHRGLGLKFMLDQVNPYLYKGDIVIIVPEYMLLTGDTSYYDINTLIQGVALTHTWKALDDKPILTIADGLLKSNSAIFKYLLDTRRNWFNKDCDIVYHLALPNSKYLLIDSHEDIVSQTSIQYLSDFVTNNTSRGVTSLLVYPCIEKRFYLQHSTSIEAIAEALRKKGIQTLSNPQDFVYDHDLFYNSIYHLNARGRKLRTEKIIQLLKIAMNDKNIAAASTSSQ